MPIEFIPNQPVLFESPLEAQACLNNDNRVYAQPVNDSDQTCIQVKITPCNEDIGCEPDMYWYENPGTILFTWMESGGWTTPVGNIPAYDGTGGVVGSIYQDFSGALIPGAVYQIFFTISSVTGNASVTIRLGLSVTTESYSAPGTYYVYLIAQDANDELEIIMNPAATTAGDTMEFSDIGILQSTDCWLDGLSAGYPSWSYVADSDYLTYFNGKFCAVDVTAGTLTNNNAYTTDNIYHSVSLRITNCTAGGLSVTLGGTLLGTTSGNGTFKFYGIPTDASGDLIFAKVDSFDGCVDQVHVDEYFETATLELELVDLDGNEVTVAPLNPDFYQDRAIWCFPFNDLSFGTEGLPCDIYKFKITDANCGEPATYTSISMFAYKFEGWPCTVQMKATCDGDAFGFIFDDDAGTNIFSLVHRIRMLQFNPTYPAKAEEYLTSAGSNLRSYGESAKVREAWIDRVDEATHDVIRLQLLSDTLQLDMGSGPETYFAPAQDYEPEWAANGKYNLAQVRFDLIKASETSKFNRYC